MKRGNDDRKNKEKREKGKTLKRGMVQREGRDEK